MSTLNQIKSTINESEYLCDLIISKLQVYKNVKDKI